MTLEGFAPIGGSPRRSRARGSPRADTAAQPLAGLRAALKDWQELRWRTQRLAGALAGSSATALLIDQVRFGGLTKLVAMAALHKTAGVQVAIGDRDGWLVVAEPQ